jgi:hypothetical protein
MLYFFYVFKIYIVRNAQRRTSQKREGEAEAEIDIPPEREAFAPEEIDFEVALIALIAYLIFTVVISIHHHRDRK